MQCLKTYTSCAEGTICSYSMLASWGTWDSDKKKSRKIAYLALFAKSIIFKLIYIYLFSVKMVAATYSLFRTSLTRGDALAAMTVNCKWAWKRKSSLKDTARSLCSCNTSRWPDSTCCLFSAHCWAETEYSSFWVSQHPRARPHLVPLKRRQGLLCCPQDSRLLTTISVRSSSTPWNSTCNTASSARKT